MDISIRISSGMQLPGKIYKPAGETKKVMLLIHGLGDHFDRYIDWSERFAKEGVAVVGVDLPGHGRAPGKKGHIKNYHVYNDVIDCLAEKARKEFGNLPMGIYGHSLGGNIVLNYLLTNTWGFKFSIITSPWLILAQQPPKVLMAIARLANVIAPGLLQPNGLNADHITTVEEVNTKYSNDPLAHDRVSVRLACEALDAAQRILDTGSGIDIPVLVLHGTEDMICSPEGSKKFADGKSNVELKLWDGGYHELQNESFNDKVFDYINLWLNKL